MEKVSGNIDNQQPTPATRNQKPSPTATPNKKPSALDNKHQTNNNKKLPRQIHLIQLNKRQMIGAKRNAKIRLFLQIFASLPEITIFAKTFSEHHLTFSVFAKN
jgi:hypothetical protein